VFIRVQHKFLALKESFLAAWIAGAFRPYVDRRAVCEPQQSALISRSGSTDGLSDTFKQCRLLRPGELVLAPATNIGRSSRSMLSNICRSGPMQPISIRRSRPNSVRLE